MRKFIFIINPISGGSEKDAIRKMIVEKSAQKKIDYQILPSTADGDYSHLHQKIKEEEITDVVIIGGDGTVNQVINSLRVTNVRFGIIPCGSGNGMAFAANIPKAPSKAFDVLFSGKEKQVDGFLCNENFACMLVGLGLDAKIAHDFAQRSKRGLLTYIQEGVKNFFSAKAYSFELEIGENHLPIEAFFISIANSNQFGNHVTIAPKASLNDGKLDVVIATRQNKFNLVVEGLMQLAGWNALQEKGRITTKKGIIYLQTDRLTIKNTSNAPLHIDGEPAPTNSEFVIKVLPRCFRLITGDKI